MAKLPDPQDPTLLAMDAAVEARARKEEPRPYLGMSSIGESCSRRLWLSFRWAFKDEIPAGTLYKFEDGHRTETLIAERLRLVPGVELHTVGPDGEQFGFSDVGGHLKGHMDGAIRGLLQAPKTWHVWECKATDEKTQDKLEKLKAEKGEKDALAAWSVTYYSQAVMYMSYSGMERHYLNCTTPGGRRTVSVRTEANPAEAARLRAKAEAIIKAPQPLARISEDASWYECKWCPAREICHGTTVPAAGCRTCVHATPVLDGNATWRCEKHNMTLSTATQRVGCADHLYIPGVLAFAKQIDAGADFVEYVIPADGRSFRNGPRAPLSYASSELAGQDASIIGDAGVEALRTGMGAKVRSAA